MYHLQLTLIKISDIKIWSTLIKYSSILEGSFKNDYVKKKKNNPKHLYNSIILSY